MRINSRAAGHLAAIFTIFIWGITFVSTKMLLDYFSPLEILFFRFVIGYVALLLIYPRPLKLSVRQELLFAATGFCGVTLYFLMENMALSLTLASNVGVIIAVAPFLTALLALVFLKSEKPRLQFFAGFAVAITGVALISLNGQAFELNPLGDLLTLFAALAWAVYAILLRRVGALGHSSLLCTRRIFLYGLVTMLPAFLFMDFSPDFSAFLLPANIVNFLFLGLGASAVCYITWNFATRKLGAVKTSVYIYAQPVVTVVFSVLFLHETFTGLALLGTVLTLLGLVISEYHPGALRALLAGKQQDPQPPNTEALEQEPVCSPAGVAAEPYAQSGTEDEADGTHHD